MKIAKASETGKRESVGCILVEQHPADYQVSTVAFSSWRLICRRALFHLEALLQRPYMMIQIDDTDGVVKRFA